MTRPDRPLNPTQLEVLEWVQYGCPNGVYEDWAHLIVARALHNRGLLLVAGHGTWWNAALPTDGGRSMQDQGRAMAFCVSWPELEHVRIGATSRLRPARSR
jgi:hypothetical protein